MVIAPLTPVEDIKTIDDLQDAVLDLKYRVDCGYISQEDYESRNRELTQVALEFNP